MAEELVKKDDGLWHPKGGLIEEVVEERVGGPVKIETTAARKHVEVLPFESFALSDEKSTVKVYFGLKGAKTLLPPKSVTVTVRVQALEVVAEASASRRYRFHESILFERVIPDKCKVKVKTDHIIVTLVKEHATVHWENISVNRKAIGPVRKSPPDFGRAVVLEAGGDAQS